MISALLEVFLVVVKKFIFYLRWQMALGAIWASGANRKAGGI